MPEECTIDPAQPKVIPLTLATWRTLRSVNARVNGRIKPMTDKAHWGVVDRWDFPMTASAIARITSCSSGACSPSAACPGGRC